MITSTKRGEPIGFRGTHKKLRKGLDLTQQKFADRLGVKQNTIALIESGKRNTSDQLLFSICREFGVNEKWLRTGEGEPFLPKADTALDRLVAEHNLTSGDYLLIKKFLELKPDVRKAILDYTREVAASIENLDAAADADQQWKAKAPQEMTDAELHAELDRQLAEEKKRAANGSDS